MRNIVLYTLAFLCIIAPKISFAQKMPMSEEHKFNLQVFYAMNKLHEYNEIYDDDSAEDFIKLFQDGISIYNDLLGLSFTDKLTIKEYATILKSNAEEIDVICKNVNKDSIYKADGIWHMMVSFDKEISYFNKCGVYFSSRNFYKSDHKMKAVFAWNEKNQTVKIVALDGRMDGKRAPLTEDYFVIQSETKNEGNSKDANKKTKSNQNTTIFDERLAHVLINNTHPIILDSTYNQAIISTNIESAKFKYKNDADVRVKAVPVNEDCNFYKLKFSPTRWRLKAYTELSMGDFYNINIASRIFETSSSGQEFGLEIGYICPSSKKTKFGIFLGAGLSTSEMTFSQEGLSYNYTTKNGEADVDGDDYIRYYSLNSIEQSITFKDVFVPFYFNFDRRFGKYFSMYMDLGAKAYLNLETDATKFKANYSTYGKYEKYDNLILDYRSGINGFTNNGTLNEANVVQPKLEIEPFSLDAFGRLGFRIAVTKWLLLDCSGGYQINVIENLKLNENILQTSMKGSDNAIVKYSAASNSEQVKNLLDYAKSAKRQAIKLNIGLMLKF